MYASVQPPPLHSSLTPWYEKSVRRRVLEAASRSYVEKFGDGEGGVVATFEILYWIAWGQSSVKPLRRGSVPSGFSDKRKEPSDLRDFMRDPEAEAMKTGAESDAMQGDLLGLDGIDGVRMFKVDESSDPISIESPAGEKDAEKKK